MRPPVYQDFKDRKFVCFSLARCMFEKLYYNLDDTFLFRFPVMRKNEVIGFAVICDPDDPTIGEVEVLPEDTIYGKALGESLDEADI